MSLILAIRDGVKAVQDWFTYSILGDRTMLLDARRANMNALFYKCLPSFCYLQGFMFLNAYEKESRRVEVLTAMQHAREWLNPALMDDMHPRDRDLRHLFDHDVRWESDAADKMTSITEFVEAFTNTQRTLTGTHEEIGQSVVREFARVVRYVQSLPPGREIVLYNVFSMY
jgi:hypothetical protein